VQLTVHRIWFSPLSTQGQLDIDGIFQCYTLEPPKGPSYAAPFCIPLGTYPVRMGWSNHFQRIVPHILDVPGREYIEIHPGNFPRNTEGCLCVGDTKHRDIIGNSDLAFDELMSELRQQPDISITYVEEGLPEQSIVS